MVDKVEIKEAETTSEKPVEEKQSTQSVQGLPEKFKSVEEMAKSYSELEKKLGEQSQSKPEERKNQNQIQKSNKHHSEAENPEHLWKTTSTQQCTAGTATGISSNIISITQMSRIQEHIFRSTTNIPVEPPRCKEWEHSVEVTFPRF